MSDAQAWPDTPDAFAVPDVARLRAPPVVEVKPAPIVPAEPISIHPKHIQPPPRSSGRT